MTHSLTIGLVGNPNCGKTTLFNILAGMRQRVGNWPGVTVERKSGRFIQNNIPVEVVDLPGTYSLNNAIEASVDERIACDFILQRQADVIVNILDASNLERNLYLTMQLIEMRVPVVLAINMMDVARKRGIKIQLTTLEKMLGCPVVALEANRKKGVQALKDTIIRVGTKGLSGSYSLNFEVSEIIKQAIAAITLFIVSWRRKQASGECQLAEKNLDASFRWHDEGDGGGGVNFRWHDEGDGGGGVNFRWDDEGDGGTGVNFRWDDEGDGGTGVNFRWDDERDGGTGVNFRWDDEGDGDGGLSLSWVAIRLLENDGYVQGFFSQDVLEFVKQWQDKIFMALNEDADILLADARYQTIQKILKQSTVTLAKNKTWTDRIDQIVLNRFLGIPIFLAIMYSLFLFVINIGGAFQDFFDIGSHTIFVESITQGLTQLHAPSWLIALLANGIGKGINTTLTFIPVIGALFLFLSFLEDSGYMGRAAFVVDRGMQALGLPGKSFVPMIVGFGCNVPAVMATRTLENRRDRILTIMMSPFMSCGARLAIYAVFTTAFFPVGGQNIVFLLYLIGIAMAMMTGFFLRKTVLHGESAPLVMELPPYHIPQVKILFLHAWQRLKGFVFRAGKLIIPICILIGGLSSISIHGSFITGEGDGQSLLSALGRFITPVFSPMGIHQDNWPATVGLFTGVLAKEVVVGTLNALYVQLGHVSSVLPIETFSLWNGLKDALMSIPANLSQLGHSLGNPVLAQAPVHTLNQSVYGVMYQHFDGQIGALAYLLFVLLYFPCVSTTAAMLREVNRAWTLFSVFWTTALAYGVATSFYQIATFAAHPVSSILWVICIITVLGLVILGMRVLSFSWANRAIHSVSLEAS